jgi:hypothetical protein
MSYLCQLVEMILRIPEAITSSLIAIIISYVALS